MMKTKVWSVMPINAEEKESLRFILQHSQNRNRDLANAFPHRFKRRQGGDIFFDAGRRRYCTEIG